MATVTLRQPLLAWEDSLLGQVNCVEQPKSRRKQHRSCDQCRKGKRGCDAVILHDFANSPGSLSSDFAGYHGEGTQGRGSSPLGPCSNCAKTGKDCTFAWLRSQERDRVRRVNDRSGPSSKRAKLSATGSQPDISSTDNRLLEDNQGQLNFPSMSPLSSRTLQSVQSEFSPVSCLGRSIRRPSSHHHCGDILEGDNVFATPNNDFSPSLPRWNGRSFCGEEFNQPIPFSGFASSNSVNNPEAMGGSFSEDTNHSINSFPYSFSEPPRTEGQPTSYPSKSRKRSLNRPADISPYSIPERLAMFTNKSLVTENLMKVYHDSLENALSCWLTERTCPYGIRALRPSGARSVDPSMLHEWGPNWSNRICGQVFNLDRVSATILDRPLTRLEDKTASKALNLAIMAFATQWSQSSERSRTKFRPFDTYKDSWKQSNDPVAENLEAETVATDTRQDSTPPAMDFDRVMQESLWAQARRAIQDATHIESFRVVFAHIIFALTQRPLSVDQHFSLPQSKDRNPSSRDIILALESEYNGRAEGLHHSANRSGAMEGHSGLMEELEGVIEHDGPPVFLEQGLRHIHSLRYKWEGLKFQRLKIKDGGATADSAEGDSTSTHQNWKTVDLLYWLGIMFDTLSAAMHKRPLVVSDEDSDVHPDIPPNSNGLRHRHFGGEFPFNKQNVPICEPNGPKPIGTSHLWDSFFFQAQQTRSRSSPVRWPCSYETAATTLADAAPIKVLLFRKVTRIQTLLSRHIPREKLKVAIKDALYVYRYWNTVYGPFILDCIANHDQLPARIQSWYICLTGHWHLAALLLADIIEAIDVRSDFESHRRERELSGLVTALRQRSAYAVADLASCSCPRDDASFPDAYEFHFAVNQGALLTEPWTQVLIRVFSKAGALLLADAARSKYGTDLAGSCKDGLKRSGECAEALWYLGRKSDMAFLAAKILTKALKDLMEDIAAPEMSQMSEDWLEAEFSVNGDLSFSVPSSESEGSFPSVGDADFGILAEHTVLDSYIDPAGAMTDFNLSEIFP